MALFTSSLATPLGAQPVTPVMSLADLRNAVRQRADMVNSQFVADEELQSFINQSYFELYDLLVQKFGDNYFLAPPYSFTTDGTAEFYALPVDLYKLAGVDLQVSAPDWWISLKPFPLAERNRFSLRNFQAFYGMSNLHYAMAGANLWLKPIPAAGQSLRLWYVPRLTPLTADDDTVDGISGWTEYVIVDAAIKCLQKEESDVSVAMAQKAGLIDRIEAAAENRDQGNAQRVSDVMGGDFAWSSGGGYPGGGWGY